MIYGWGTNHVTKKVDDMTEVTCRYRYVSLMFIFSLVWNRRWFLHGRDRAMDREVTPTEIEQLYGPDAVPSPGLWRRFGVLLSLGVFLAIAAVSATVGALTDDGGGGETATAGEPVAEPVAEVASEQTDDSTDTTIAAATTDPDDGTEDTEDTAAAPATGNATIQQVAESITLVSDSNLISTDATGPIEEIGELTVDAVHSTDGAHNGTSPGPGSKLVIVDFQILVQPLTSTGAGGVNVLDDVFRLIDGDGRAYQSVEDWSDLRKPGHVVNRSTAFEVPADLTTFALEVGVPTGQADGYTARYDITLTDGPIDATSAESDDIDITEGPVTATLTSATAIGEADPGIPYSALPPTAVDYTVLDGETAAKLGPDAADPGHKWLVLNLQVEPTTPATNVGDAALRVLADGERYSPVNTINEFVSAGEVAEIQAVFQIPATATTATLELGSPEGWDGERATYDLTLP